MTLEHQTPEQTDALGRMSKQIYDEYKNLGFGGLKLDPLRFLAFRERTKNFRHTTLIVSDAGIFFEDPIRKIRYKFHREYLFVYQSGLSPADLEKVKASDSPIILLDNHLEFWQRVGTGLCLVADHLNKTSYILSEEQRAELDRTRSLYDKEELVIRPMLQKKTKTDLPPSVQVLSLED